MLSLKHTTSTIVSQIVSITRVDEFIIGFNTIPMEKKSVNSTAA